MRLPATARWLLLALLGIVVAVAVAIAASRLASQRIGLASEPISAGDALAPAARPHPPRRHGTAVEPAKPAEPPATTAPPPLPPATTPQEPPPSPEETAPPAHEPSPSGGDGEHGGGHADD